MSILDRVAVGAQEGQAPESPLEAQREEFSPSRYQTGTGAGRLAPVGGV
jgi:hypothetical protein